MTSQEQINEIKDKYLDSLNRHDLRRDQKLYRQQLEKVQSLIASIERGRTSDSLNIIAEDNYLREVVKQNEKEIQKLQRKLKASNVYYEEVNQLKNVQQKYLNMISKQFQDGMQQKLSTIRGKVDQLKKKIKQINKEILSFEQQHVEGLDQYSLSLSLLKQYQQKTRVLKDNINKFKSSQKK